MEFRTVVEITQIELVSIVRRDTNSALFKF